MRPEQDIINTLIDDLEGATGWSKHQLKLRAYSARILEVLLQDTKKV